MAGAGLTKVEGEGRVGLRARSWRTDWGLRMRVGLRIRAGDVMLEGTRAVAVDDWCGGQSRGRWMRDQRTGADERGINCKAGDGSGLESSRFDG